MSSIGTGPKNLLSRELFLLSPITKTWSLGILQPEVSSGRLTQLTGVATECGNVVLHHDRKFGSLFKRKAIKRCELLHLPSSIPSLRDFYTEIDGDFDLSIDIKDSKAVEEILDISKEFGKSIPSLLQSVIFFKSSLLSLTITPSAGSGARDPQFLPFSMFIFRPFPIVLLIQILHLMKQLLFPSRNVIARFGFFISNYFLLR